jgi:transposase
MLSVDDWAWRKHQRYGTILMDLERLEVIDLLPVRSADSFAQWLSLHPGVEVITRDRSSLYADGGRRGAPLAIQITDRFHLVSNLGEAVERDIQQLQIDARNQMPQCEAAEGTISLTLIEARRQRCRQARYQRYISVHELHGRGQTQLEISASVGVDASTVSRWLRAPDFPESL